MWHSVTSSEAAKSGQGAARRLSAIFLALFLCSRAICEAGLISVDEALASAFPDGVPHRETIFLTDEQLVHVDHAIGERPTSPMITRFRVLSGGATIGWAYLDNHRVRTLPETVMVMIDPAGSVLRVEVVSFREPLDYLPPRSWYAQFDGHKLGEDLELKRSIRPITGATLTARAATDAVRRVLAVHASTTSSEETQ